MHEQKFNRREISFGYGIASTIYALILLLDRLPSFQTLQKSTRRNIDIIGSKIIRTIKKTS